MIPKKRLDMGCHLFCWERFSFISFGWGGGKSVYCHPPWSLAVQCVEHLCICYATSPMNTKTTYVYLHGLNLYVLLSILNCWGRLLLSVSFWKRGVLKFKFLGLLFTGSLIRTFMWKCRPLMCRVWLLSYILVLLLNNLLLFYVVTYRNKCS